MAACPHVNASELQPPGPVQEVYREDCTQCFDSIDDPSGLNVCLHCFNGGCAGDRAHGLLHYKRFGHPLALNIRRTRKKVQRDEPPQKISKLAIAAETEEDRYDTSTHVVCYACSLQDLESSNALVSTVVDGILKAVPFSKREEIKAWEQEFVPCEHTLCLNQQDARQIPSQDLGQCSKCDLKENLWLCLECGNLGCGRSQFGGIGGNSHALEHADSISHAVAVKLGSITADGTADIYCYKCDEERIDPELGCHLAHWGINLAEREKTEKSLMEMQVEYNMKWEFSMIAEDGRELTPIFGPGFTGLVNLGNSCYLSSIVQCLFSLPEFKERYFKLGEEPPYSETPAQDLETQMRKLADGILSGRYSHPDSSYIASPDSPEVPRQKGLAPAMFKYLVGRGHEEFSTMRQQDAFEFLLHLFKMISLARHPSKSSNPVQAFRFAVEQRLQCLSCKKARYRVDEQDNISIPVPARRLSARTDDPENDKQEEFAPVALRECLDIFTAEEVVELHCPSCGSKDGFRKRSRFRTLPQKLVINARRFELINWVPTKLDIPVEVEDGPVDFSHYMSAGPQEGEELLPEDSVEERFRPNKEVLEQLVSMGFPEPRCEKALHATGNSDAESAMNWLLAHMDDPDIDQPLNASASTKPGGGAQQDLAKIAQLCELGIETARAEKALSATDGDINRALDWVFSHPDDVGDDDMVVDAATPDAQYNVPGFDVVPAKYVLRSIVCHKGRSVHAGHYVAFVRKTLPGHQEPSWVLFNDEKVVEAYDVHEMKKFAYLYFFSRI